MEIVGRITANATVNETKSGQKVVHFSVAINDRYRTKEGETKELTTFVNCSYWMRIGVANYLTKGKLVELTGRISANAYTNAKGEVKASLNFHVHDIKMHGGSSQPTETIEQRTTTTSAVAKDDDLPF